MAQFQPKFPTNAHASLDILDLNANINVLRASTEYVIFITELPSIEDLLSRNKNCPLIAYAYVHYNRGPPSTGSWDEYAKYLRQLVYRSPQWKLEHAKFMSASRAGAVAGLCGYITPQNVYDEVTAVTKPVVKRYKAYMMSRGVFFEPLHCKLYMRLAPGTEVRESTTHLHPLLPWLMATPDGTVHWSNAGDFIRNVEWKTPFSRDAFLVIPEEYMAQIQLTMEVTGAEVCDFASLKCDDHSHATDFIVHRVYKNEAYIDHLLVTLKAFCIAVLTGTAPPPKGHFKPVPVKSEMIVRLQDVVDLIPDGANMVYDAVLKATVESCAESGDAEYLLSALRAFAIELLTNAPPEHHCYTQETVQAAMIERLQCVIDLVPETAAMVYNTIHGASIEAYTKVGIEKK